MNIKITNVSDDFLQVEIEKEDYSLADIIHRELLNVKHVKYAGVAPPHPLIKTLSIQFHTDGAKPEKALMDALELSQERVKDLLSTATEIFPQAPRASEREEAPIAEEPEVSVIPPTETQGASSGPEIGPAPSGVG